MAVQRVKRLHARWETRVRSLGQEVPLEKEMVTHFSILAWRIPWMEQPGGLQSMGLQRVGHDSMSSLLLTRALILSWGLHPHDLIISQRPHLLIPSHQTLDFKHIKLGGGHEYAIYNNRWESPLYFTINHKQMSIKAIIRKDSESEITQSFPTLCNPMECSLPGSSIHGIFQARVLKWVTISFSKGSPWPTDQTWVSRIADRRFAVWASREAVKFRSLLCPSVPGWP